MLAQYQGTKPSQSHHSGSAAGPGALITELISEDEIETIVLSERPALTIDVSPYTIAHIIVIYICFYKKLHDLEFLCNVYLIYTETFHSVSLLTTFSASSKDLPDLEDEETSLILQATSQVRTGLKKESIYN